MIIDMELRNAESSKKWTASQLSGIAWTLYADSPPFAKALLTYRPYICPFEDLLPHVPVDSNVLDFGCGGAVYGVALFDRSIEQRIWNRSQPRPDRGRKQNG